MILPNPIKPASGQESVWEYPRPPRLERSRKRIQIIFAGTKIVDAPVSFRVLESSHPPSYYISPAFIAPGVLRPAAGSSLCEWKGQAVYSDVVANGAIAPRSAWRYRMPMDPFTAIAGFFAFYADAMDKCRVDGEVVIPQPGGFYGGWITSHVVGPFKGEPGSM